MRTLTLIMFLILFSDSSYSNEKNKTDVEFSSDNLVVDENKNIMTATGNVIIISKKMSVKADTVIYDKKADKATATGNVMIEGDDGSIFKSEKVILTDEFKAISAIPLFGTFKDKSNIKAKSFAKKGDGSAFFKEGTYTACDCDLKNNDPPPVWTLNSREIEHNPISKTVYHKNVTMKLFSYPILYVPFLSHPDWTVKRRSGFLTPSFGYSSRNGFDSSIPYYFATNDKTWDMTFTNHFKGKNGYANQMNFRKKYEETDIETNLFQGNLNTHKGDHDSVFAANFDLKTSLKNNWNLSINGKYTDQDTFMNRYGFDNSTEYKSFIKANKIERNKISEIEIYKIRNLSNDSNASINEPTIAPNIYYHSFNNKKNMNYEFKLNAHEIKDDEGYDIQRWAGNAQIEKIMQYGDYELKFNGETGLDLYAINERPSSDQNDNKYLERLSLGFALTASKEAIRNYQQSNLFLKPTIQFASMFSTDRKEDIPNRDSSDFRLDSSNLFFVNQFQGRDNIQTNHRINYGLNSAVISNKYGDIDFFLGQSQRVGGTENNTLISNPNRMSNIINNISWNFSENTNISWDSLYDNETLKTNYSNISLNSKIFGIDFSTSHSSLDGTLVNDNEDREEYTISLSKKYDNWNFGYTSKYDLSNDNTEQITEEVAIDYTEEYMFQNCLNIKLSLKNNGGSVDRDLKPENSIYLTFSFRNLGDYDYKAPSLF